MRKLSFISIWLFSISIACSAQRISSSATEVKELLCRSWKFDHVLENGVVSKDSHLRNIDLIFYQNYTYGTVIFDRKKKGSWCYNEDENSIELTTAEGDTTTRIFLLEKDKLILISSKDLLKDKTILSKSYAQLSPK